MQPACLCSGGHLPVGPGCPQYQRCRRSKLICKNPENICRSSLKLVSGGGANVVVGGAVGRSEQDGWMDVICVDDGACSG